ncbi:MULTISPECIES: hypothetical protein [Roseobacteraceae]|uniref:Uncharacterized protein n=2 Tax=Marivita cryptomonadis TaxID=505252 RepID=A0A9Q2RW40_9RHOB|nr:MULTISPECIES: hypothetical protein [Roseobacteraceae]MBM2320507.1 hypothetical protein [Marivita cryptomonadis]MBM2339674.1 hypothetical protein [Marivita cryptomonadis]MBM2344333.1 hypothetical protein [Marivita cryptomonadis]MBM2363526.1 hypothetical protein [Marivita cryptomonadis]MBM2368194.1 hypothetical protein [Marivita cryptomonadis]|tara:strand:+ start:13875 stop:14084 length:210 start_codon:yes stop_codon:yes gene_type:complete
MTRHTPIMASETTAARLLDLRTNEFKALVDEGHLPPGHEIAPGVVRWDTEVLKRISAGDVTELWDQIQW